PVDAGRMAEQARHQLADGKIGASGRARQDLERDALRQRLRRAETGCEQQAAAEDGGASGSKGQDPAQSHGAHPTRLLRQELDAPTAKRPLGAAETRSPDVAGLCFVMPQYT